MNQTITEVPQRLPFLSKRGTLYAALSDTPEPDLTVMRGRFVRDWPNAWVGVGNTDPEFSMAEWDAGRPTQWTIALWSLSMAPTSTRTVYGMIGWESEDDRDRILAPVMDYRAAAKQAADRVVLRFLLAPESFRAYFAAKPHGRNVS